LIAHKRTELRFTSVNSYQPIIVNPPKGAARFSFSGHIVTGRFCSARPSSRHGCFESLRCNVQLRS
jgi:hypothetical protein